MEEREKVPASQPCDNCQKELSQITEIVKAGGIHIKCTECGLQGVVGKDKQLAIKVRATSGIQAPDPIGCKITCRDHQF